MLNSERVVMKHMIVAVLLGASPLLSAQQASNAAADFAARCDGEGVILCQGFDDDSAVAGRWGDWMGVSSGKSNNVEQGYPPRPTIDYQIKASGAGSIRLDVPPYASSQPSGNWFTNFSKDRTVRFGENSNFFVQFRQRISEDYLVSPAHKIAIIAEGDLPSCGAPGKGTLTRKSGGGCGEACSPNEVVLVAGALGYPVMYNACSSSPSHGPYDGFEANSTTSFGQHIGRHYYLPNNAMPAPYCYKRGRHPQYGSPNRENLMLPPTGNCWPIRAGEWITWQIEIKTGTYRDREWHDSHVRLWAAHEGEPSQLVIDWGPYNLTAASGSGRVTDFGKIWLMTFQTGRKIKDKYPAMTTWYDELIISTRLIPDPGTGKPPPSPEEAAAAHGGSR